MLFRLTRGLDIGIPGSPASAPTQRAEVTGVGISGADYPGLRPEFLVEQGEQVAAGQALLRDRRRPEIRVTSPIAGSVTQLARRAPDTASFFIGISAAPGEPRRFESSATLQQPDALREMLLASGLWTALLERPFGRIPDPAAAPDAIVVSATPADPLSPDPAAVIAGREADLAAGVEALGRLTEGPVHVCQFPGPLFVPDAKVFDGAFPAGLPGVQVHHLCPVDGRRRCWTIDYQDVLAIGCLLRSGELRSERIVSLAGPGVREPCLLEAPTGAALEDLTRGRLEGTNLRILAGPVLTGREAQFLGRSHRQVSVLPARGRKRARRAAAHAAVPGPIIPVAAHDLVFPFDVPVVPLLRALAVCDAEGARDLGCLELLEEDVSVLSHVCPSGNDYARLLRNVLHDLQRNM